MRFFNLVPCPGARYGYVLSPTNFGSMGIGAVISINLLGNARRILGDVIEVRIGEKEAKSIRLSADKAGWRNSVSFFVNHIEDFIPEDL